MESSEFRSALTWFMVGVLLTAVFVSVQRSVFGTFQRFGLTVFETTTFWLLKTFNPGTLPQSKPISGPKWQFPNGSILQRFIAGREHSEKWRIYGPVYRLWSGSHPEMYVSHCFRVFPSARACTEGFALSDASYHLRYAVITTPKDFKHFSSDANDHPKPHNMNLGWFVGEVIGQCLGFHNGEEWNRIRRIYEPDFTHSAAVARIEGVDRAASSYVEKLSQLTTRTVGRNSRASFSLPVGDAFNKFPYFLTASTIYGPMTEAEENELWRITEKRNGLLPFFLGGGPYRNGITAWLFDRGAIKSLREFETEWRDYNTRMVAARRAKGGYAPILKYWEQYENGTQTLDELVQTLDELLMLNLDVITHVLTWFITLVSDHSDVQKELQDEIAEHQTDLLQYINRFDTHLHRCFTESMRVRPFAIFTPGECSNQVKNFDGVLIKPGTQILLDVLAINVRNPFWGTDSAVFRPSRLRNIKSLDLRYNLHSFGIGSRKCMGQYTAGHIVKALGVHLFKQYDVALADEKQEGYDVEKSSWTPKASARLRLTKRAAPP